MAVTVRVRRVANPHRKYHRRPATAKRPSGRNPGHRRRAKLTARQIKFFGTRRQKAGLKAARRRKRTQAGSRPRHRARTRAVNPRRRAVVRVRRRRNVTPRRRKHVAHRRSKRNPALIVTLGAVNPQKRRVKKVAHKRKHVKHYAHRKRANPSHRRRRRNPTRVVVVAPRSRRSRHSRRRRNPEVFGARAGSLASVKMIVGGLAGMAATKFLPTLVPASLSGSSNIVRVVLSAAAAYVSSLIAAKVPGVDKSTASAVFFGGLIQTGSVALNAFLPSIGRQFGLTGMGELTPGNFLVPQNPLRRVITAPATAGRVNMSGIDRAFGRAF